MRKEPASESVVDESLQTAPLPEAALHCLRLGEKVQLKRISTCGRDSFPDQTAALREFQELRRELIGWQRRLYAESNRKLLVVLQAMDAGGKDGTIRHVFRGMNPQGVTVSAFRQPTSEELARDYLWRIHRCVPSAGMIGIFNRSHYEDVLVPKVEKGLPPETLQLRYEQINQFERFLTDTGTVVRKFYLHISREEQRKRFLKRLQNREKSWKFSESDLEKRQDWKKYQQAYEEMLHRCNTAWAPWHLIPGDQKWYRNLAVARALVQTFREMNPQFPPHSMEFDQIKTRLRE